MSKAKIDHTAIRSRLVNISKIHLFIGLFFVAQIIAYDAAKLITPEVLLKRWFATGGLLLAAMMVWYFAKLNKSPTVLKNLTWFLVAADLAFATFNIYTQRGMSSRAVILYLLAILTAALLRTKGAILLTATAAAIAYSTTAVAYFVLNFNEGYKIELYGELGLYSALLMAFGSITWSLVKQKH